MCTVLSFHSSTAGTCYEADTACCRSTCPAQDQIRPPLPGTKLYGYSIRHPCDINFQKKTASESENLLVKAWLFSRLVAAPTKSLHQGKGALARGACRRESISTADSHHRPDIKQPWTMKQRPQQKTHTATAVPGCYLPGDHDNGKANPGLQFQGNPPAWAHLRLQLALCQMTHENLNLLWTPKTRLAREVRPKHMARAHDNFSRRGRVVPVDVHLACASREPRLGGRRSGAHVLERREGLQALY